MLKNQFEEWLLGMKACPQRVAYARSSNVARIEREKGLDLDEVFIDASVWGDLLAQFDYPMESWKKTDKTGAWDSFWRQGQLVQWNEYLAPCSPFVWGV